MPTSPPPKIISNGKMYKIYKSYDTKHDALSNASWIRKLGWNARVVPFERQYYSTGEKEKRWVVYRR